MFRSIIAILIAILYLIITLPVVCVLLIIERSDPKKRERIARPMIQWVFRMFLSVGGAKVHVSGTENIPEDGPCLFIGNHRGIFDVITTYTLTDRELCYVSKDSLAKIPLFSTWMRLIGCLFFDRSDLRDGMRMLKDAMQKINDGTRVFIFPEGTRSKGDTELPLLPFHEGTFRIATRTGCPIVPVAIRGTAEFFERQYPRLCPTDIYVSYGEPIDPTVFSRSEQKHMGERLQGVITDMLSSSS